MPVELNRVLCEIIVIASVWALPIVLLAAWLLERGGWWRQRRG